jgi:hypothetical protein
MSNEQSPAVRSAVNPEEMAAILRRTGYRATVAELAGQPQVQSAAQGLGFFIGFGNAEPAAPGAFIDLAFQCLISIQGEVPAGMIEGWNRSMRFARLFRQDAFLVLTMDVVLAGGVTDDYLCAQCELWDRVIRDFILHLRNPAAEPTTGS